jgi:hypothetical protein
MEILAYGLGFASIIAFLVFMWIDTKSFNHKTHK